MRLKGTPLKYQMEKKKNKTGVPLDNLYFFILVDWFLFESDSEFQILVRSQKQLSFAQIETQASDAKSDAEMVLGSFACLLVWLSS